MNTHANKLQENKSQSVANTVPTFQFINNRQEAIAQLRLQEKANSSQKSTQIAQLQAITKNHPQSIAQRKLKEVVNENQTSKYGNVAQLMFRRTAPSMIDFYGLTKHLEQGILNTTTGPKLLAQIKKLEKETGHRVAIRPIHEDLRPMSEDMIGSHYHQNKLHQIQLRYPKHDSAVAVLMHELVHAYDGMQGRLDEKPTPKQTYFSEENAFKMHHEVATELKRKGKDIDMSHFPKFSYAHLVKYMMKEEGLTRQQAESKLSKANKDEFPKIIWPEIINH